MKLPGKRFVLKRVLIYEIAAFAVIIAIVWLDEIFDIPHLFFGAPKTPINWREGVFESACVFMVGVSMVYITFKIFKKMKYLEGLLPVCASCKKIRDDKNAWKEMEVYVRDRSDAEFSHGICPDCAARLYPEYSLYEKKG